MGDVKEISSWEDFQKIISETGDTLIVVDFFADWCGPCRTIGPYVKTLATEFSGSVHFLKVNVDDCDKVAKECGISAMPTFQFYKNGSKVGELVGANQEKLKATVVALK